MKRIIKSVFTMPKMLYENIFLKSDDVARHLTNSDFEIIDAIIKITYENQFFISDDILKAKMSTLSYETKSYRPMYYLSINDFQFLGRNPSNTAYKFLTAKGYSVSQIGAKAYFINNRKKNATTVLVEIIKFAIPVIISLAALFISINKPC